MTLSTSGGRLSRLTFALLKTGKKGSFLSYKEKYIVSPIKLKFVNEFVPEEAPKNNKGKSIIKNI